MSFIIILITTPIFIRINYNGFEENKLYKLTKVEIELTCMKNTSAGLSSSTVKAIKLIY